MLKLIAGLGIGDRVLCADKVYAVTAIISLNGFKLLYEYIQCPIKLIIGTNLAIHLDAIEMIKRYRNIECRAETRKFLHSKFWLIEKGSKRYSIVGSQNTSFSALIDNIETAVISDDKKLYKELMTVFNHLWKNATPLNELSQETIHASIVGWREVKTGSADNKYFPTT